MPRPCYVCTLGERYYDTRMNEDEDGLFCSRGSCGLGMLDNLKSSSFDSSVESTTRRANGPEPCDAIDKLSSEVVQTILYKTTAVPPCLVNEGVEGEEAL